VLGSFAGIDLTILKSETSQTRMVLSQLPAATIFPSGEMASNKTSPVWFEACSFPAQHLVPEPFPARLGFFLSQPLSACAAPCPSEFFPLSLHFFSKVRSPGVESWQRPNREH